MAKRSAQTLPQTLVKTLVKTLASRAASTFAKTAAVAWLALLTLVMPGTALAAPVEGIYTETVPVADASPEATRAAFAEALRRVLVKATGRASAGRDSALLARFGDPSALVQQFRRDSSGNLWAQFDPAAVRRGLQAAGVPVWSDDRPLTIAWVAYDAGEGARDVLAGSAGDGVAVGLRRELQIAAQARGVPVALPLRDSQEAAAVRFADVWADASEPVVKASGRYRADAILIGRARLAAGGAAQVRWTLLAGGERSEWSGGIADGPQGLADRLSQHLTATSAPALGPTRLAVSGIASLNDYGTVLAYLSGLGIVESVQVARIADDTIDFELALRGGPEQLARALAGRSLMTPEPPPAGADPAVMRYRLQALQAGL